MRLSLRSGSHHASSGRARRIIWLSALAIAAILLATLPSVAFALPRPPWNPGPPWAPVTPHSSEMRLISDLFWVMLILSAIVFFGVAGAIIYSAVHFSAKPGDTEEPTQIYGHRGLEMLWTALPFVILVIAFGFTVRAIHDINTPPKGSHPLDIDAIGHQWWWEFQYPTLGIVTADEIHVPAGVPLHFHVESRDVIHSFWVPELQRQIDANPAQDNAVFAAMNTPGVYGGMCYEYCGAGHAWMKFEMVVQPKAQFNAWAKSQIAPAATPTTSLEKYGQYVFLHNTCIDCHAITGTTAGGAVAPNLTHVGSRWTIGAGAAPVDVPDVMAWIQNPKAYKPGVNMPGFPLLSQKDLKALATYIVSLK